MADVNDFYCCFLDAIENLVGGFRNEFDEYSRPLRSRADAGGVGDETDRFT